MKKKIIVLLMILVVIIAIAGYFIVNKINLNNRAYQIEEISEVNYFIVKSNDKYGVIDKSGKKIIEEGYDKVEIPNPSKDLFVCFKDGKGIALNSNGQKLFEEYNSVDAIELRNGSTNFLYEKSILKAEKGGKYGLIDLSGKIILDIEYDNIEAFSGIEGQLQITKDGKLGVANMKGTILVKPEYDSITSDGYYDDKDKYEHTGYIVGQKYQDGYKYGYINSEGKLKLKLEYNDISRITDDFDKNETFLIVAKNGQYGVVKNYKNILENEYQDIEYDNINNVFILQKGKNYGVANTDGKIIIPVQNTSVQAKGEYIYVERNNIKQVYDGSGNKTNVDFDTSIMSTANDNYKIVLNSKETKNYYGVMGSDNKQIIKTEYLYIAYAFDDYFIVCGEDGKLGILDSNEKVVLDLKYDLVEKIQGKDMIQTLSKDTGMVEVYSKDMTKICEMQNAIIENKDNYLKVYSNNELKYFNNEGKEVLGSELFANYELFASVKDGKWGYVDKSGNDKVPYEYEFATEFNQYGYAGIKKDGKWGAIDSKGNIVVEPKFDLSNNYNNVEFIGEYVKIDSGFGNYYFTNEI